MTSLRFPSKTLRASAGGAGILAVIGLLGAMVTALPVTTLRGDLQTQGGDRSPAFDQATRDFAALVARYVRGEVSREQGVATLAAIIRRLHVAADSDWCGNERTEGAEECDDGEENGRQCFTTDGVGCRFCSATCRTITVVPDDICGNGVWGSNEECDDGPANDVTCRNTSCDSFCTPACRRARVPVLPRCANGVVEHAEEEQCDDGNRMDGDGCSGACLAEEGYVCQGDPSTCTCTRITLAQELFPESEDYFGIGTPLSSNLNAQPLSHFRTLHDDTFLLGWNMWNETLWLSVVDSAGQTLVQRQADGVWPVLGVDEGERVVFLGVGSGDFLESIRMLSLDTLEPIGSLPLPSLNGFVFLSGLTGEYDAGRKTVVMHGMFWPSNTVHPTTVAPAVIAVQHQFGTPFASVAAYEQPQYFDRSRRQVFTPRQMVIDPASAGHAYVYDPGRAQVTKVSYGFVTANVDARLDLNGSFPHSPLIVAASLGSVQQGTLYLSARRSTNEGVIYAVDTVEMSILQELPVGPVGYAGVPSVDRAQDRGFALFAVPGGAQFIEFAPSTMSLLARHTGPASGAAFYPRLLVEDARATHRDTEKTYFTPSYEGGGVVPPRPDARMQFRLTRYRLEPGCSETSTPVS